MLALWMYLGFDCCWVSFWWVLPSSWLTEGHSTQHILYSVVQVQTGCVEAVLLSFLGFDGSLTIGQLFVWVISPPFSCNFSGPGWRLVWLPLTPPHSSFIICWWFLCWWVVSSSKYLVVHSSHLPFKWSVRRRRQNGLRLLELFYGI